MSIGSTGLKRMAHYQEKKVNFAEKNKDEQTSGKWSFWKSNSKQKGVQKSSHSTRNYSEKQDAKNNEQCKPCVDIQPLRSVSDKFESSAPVNDEVVLRPQNEVVVMSAHTDHEDFSTLPCDLDGSDLTTANEDILRQELEEARTKALQMEKTMRWWSDCTANWREKWGKVRAERNKLRDELKILKGRNDILSKELIEIKRDYEDKIALNQTLKNELERTKYELKKFDREKRTAIVEPHQQTRIHDINPKNKSQQNVLHQSSVYESTIPKLGAELQFLEQILAENKVVLGLPMDEVESTKVDPLDRTYSPGAQIGDVLEELNLTRKKFNECKKNLAERIRENCEIKEELENLKSNQGRNSAMSTATDVVQDRDGDDNLYPAVPKSTKDLKLRELRQEIEKLQNENSLEWARREQAESERQRLDRENRRMKEQIEELEEEIRKKTEQVAHAQSVGMKCLQDELEQKTEELLECKMTNNKQKKQVQEKTDELNHERKRTEQYEAEMKKLRSRVEELKRQLSTTEDTADRQANVVRRLQRSFEEKCQEVDNLQTEIQHLHQRMRRQTHQSRVKETETTHDSSNSEGDEGEEEAEEGEEDQQTEEASDV